LELFYSNCKRFSKTAPVEAVSIKPAQIGGILEKRFQLQPFLLNWLHLEPFC
jgi:hypothetical protein